MNWLGLDIGGANLKGADGLGWARTVPFALWREPENLAAALADLINSGPLAERIAVTMTGELCDCFRTKAEGVRHILAAVREAAEKREVVVYLVDGQLVSIERALAEPRLAAASNWHALASFACRFVGPESGVLVDIGSTTTDIIPLVGGRPAARGQDDTSRLLAGELVYMGVGRTPVSSLCRTLPWQGQACPVAAELFAMTADAYVLLGNVPEQPGNTATADGRPLTKEFARARIARMICADVTDVRLEDAEGMAEHVFDIQAAEIGKAIRRVVENMANPPKVAVMAGEGEFLASPATQRVLPSVEIIRLTNQVTLAAGHAAPAHALAVLARAL